MLNHMVEHPQFALDETYGALSHAIRREMVERLRDGDARVTELAGGFAVSLAAASKHIQVLEAAGLVRRTVRGRNHHLSLDPRPLAEASEWIEATRAFWAPRLDALEALLRERNR
jgi:DNA-binding transcriptional ArsR family regulator